MRVPITETTRFSAYGKWLADKLRMPVTEIPRTDSVTEREGVKLFSAAGREMLLKRKVGFIAVLLAALLLAAPSWAQPVVGIATPAGTWRHLTEEFVLQGSFQRPQNGGPSETHFSSKYVHWATDALACGPELSLDQSGADRSAGVGGGCEYNFRRLRKGNLFVGGSADALSGAGASFAGISEVGYKLYVGNSSALRVSADWTRAINASDAAAADQVNRLRLLVGISMGVPQGTVPH